MESELIEIEFDQKYAFIILVALITFYIIWASIATMHQDVNENFTMVNLTFDE